MWNLIPGATNRTFTTGPATVADHGKAYRVTVRSSLAELVSDTAFIRIPPPVITSEPADQSVLSGQQASFSVAAAKTSDLAVQWQYSTDEGRRWADSNEPSARSWTFTTPTRTPAHHGWMYRAVVTNPFGSTISRSATVHVAQPVVTITSPTVDQLHRSNSPVTIRGTATPGATLAWKIGGGNSTDTNGTAPVDSDGAWSVNVSELPAGRHLFEIGFSDLPDITDRITLAVVSVAGARVVITTEVHSKTARDEP